MNFSVSNSEEPIHAAERSAPLRYGNTSSRLGRSTSMSRFNEKDYGEPEPDYPNLPEHDYEKLRKDIQKRIVVRGSTNTPTTSAK